MALLLFAFNRFNPYEWGGRHRLGLGARDADPAADAFSLQGALWFAFTTLQWQGSANWAKGTGPKEAAPCGG